MTENEEEEIESRDKAREFAWAPYGRPVLRHDRKEAFTLGYNAGYERGRTKTTIQLANEYDGNGYPHSWFGPLNWYRRSVRMRIFLNRLWNMYGPTYEDDE